MPFKDQDHAYVLSRYHKWTLSEWTYVSKLISFYKDLSESESSEEFMMKFEIAKFSMRFPNIDYIALSLIFMYLGNSDVFMQLLSDTNTFDDIMKSTILPQALLQARYLLSDNLRNKCRIDKALAIAFNKFPKLFTMNFNYRRQHGKRIQRFTKKMMESNLSN